MNTPPSNACRCGDHIEHVAVEHFGHIPGSGVHTQPAISGMISENVTVKTNSLKSVRTSQAPPPPPPPHPRGRACIHDGLCLICETRSKLNCPPARWRAGQLMNGECLLNYVSIRNGKFITSGTIHNIFNGRAIAQQEDFHFLHYRTIEYVWLNDHWR